MVKSQAGRVTAMSPPSHEPFVAILARANPAVFLPALWRQRQLIRQLTWREVTGRYRTSLLGLFWSFVTPLVQLAIYTFVFGVVLKTKWPGTDPNSLSQFGLMLFAGFVAFTLFSESVTRAPGLITSSPNYVKKVVFPLEVLPVAMLGSTLFHTGISLGILVTARVVLSAGPIWTVVYAPLVLLPMVCLALGIGWMLASLGVFLRDLGHAVGIATQVLMFLTPIVYPPTIFPPALMYLVHFNPIAATVENTRRVVVQGLQPDWNAWGFALAVGLLALCIGYAWFAKTKRAFADVI